MNNNELVDRIQLALTKNGKMSWSKAAVGIGLSPQAPTKWKQGQISRENLEKLADFLQVDRAWLMLGQGDMNGIKNSTIDNSITQSIDGNNNTQIGTQNTYNLDTTIATDEQRRQLAQNDRLFLKDMPLLDIDDGVLFALHASDDNIILKNAERVATFIPHSDQAFGIKMPYSALNVIQNDIVIIEPALPPRHNDLVLMCFDYHGQKRGLLARYFVGITGHGTIQHNDEPPEPMPTGSLICGVVIEVKRRLLNNNLMKSRLNQDWNILNTLVKE